MAASAYRAGPGTADYATAVPGQTSPGSIGRNIPTQSNVFVVFLAMSRRRELCIGASPGASRGLLVAVAGNPDDYDRGRNSTKTTSALPVLRALC
jgi:hypothetical protein